MSENPTTRASLIVRLRTTDDAVAWQEFVDIYQPLVFRLARAKGLQTADALDTTQEVLARVAHVINGWDANPELGTFRGWISRITRNLVIDFLRSQNRLPRTGDDSTLQQLLDQSPARGEEADWYDLEHQRQVFRWASEKIRPEFQPATWNAFWATAIEARSVKNVAEELNLSVGAVYIARSRVMAKLKQTVGKFVSHESSALSR